MLQTEYNGCAVAVRGMKKGLGEMVKLRKLKMEGNTKKRIIASKKLYALKSEKKTGEENVVKEYKEW